MGGVSACVAGTPPLLDIIVTIENMTKNIIDIIFKTQPVQSTIHKVVLSGNFAECYRFTKPIVLNRRKPKKRISRLPLEEQQKIKDRNSQNYLKRSNIRAFSNISRLIESNFSINRCTFLTLTFRDNITDLTEALRLYHIFCVQIRKILVGFKYICVPERQKRGAYHFHILINVAFLDVNLVLRYWTHGSNKIKRPYSTYGLGQYFAKYLTKNNKDFKPKSFKRYYTSHNLTKPITLVQDKATKVRNLIYNTTLIPVFSRFYTIPDFSDFQNTTGNRVLVEKFYIKTLLPLDLSTDIR